MLLVVIFVVAVVVGFLNILVAQLTITSVPPSTRVLRS